ncbi:hypothetical protein [Sorangium sp. So ce1024]|uniref:hypothetical protein n=1 Tax=unclassified Sorangium TaxID=2621164 RepID=UPI003F0B7D87
MTERAANPPLSALHGREEPLRRTIVAAHLGAEHREGMNLVWSAGLDLAWRELARLADGPITLPGAGEHDPALAVVRALNDSPVGPGTVDEGAYVARAGMHTPELVRSLVEELRRKFGSDAEPRLLAEPASPGLFLAYACLSKHLVFDPPLVRGAWPLLFRGDSPQGSYVHSFGLWETQDEPPELWKPRVRSVVIHYPRWTDAEVGAMTDEELDRMYNDRAFVVEVLPADRRDRVIVASVEPGTTLHETVQRVMAQLDDRAEEHPRARLDPGERFQVPCVDLDVRQVYPELQGKLFAGAQLPRGVLGEVIQTVRFRLDEGGVTLRAEARGRGLCAPPREMVCERSFLVLLLRRGSLVPFFALWIANDELLVPSPEPELISEMRRAGVLGGGLPGPG